MMMMMMMSRQIMMAHALFQDIRWDLGQICFPHFAVEWTTVRTLFLPSFSIFNRRCFYFNVAVVVDGGERRGWPLRKHSTIPPSTSLSQQHNSNHRRYHFLFHTSFNSRARCCYKGDGLNRFHHERHAEPTSFLFRQ